MKQWTDEQREKIRGLVKDGMSAGQIAPMFNVSRNAVVGLVHRNKDQWGFGLAQKRGFNPDRPGAIKTKRTRRKNIPVKIDKSQDRRDDFSKEYDAQSLHISLLETTDRTCKWPVADSPEFAFCGHVTVEGKSYCEHHVRRSIGAYERMERGEV